MRKTITAAAVLAALALGGCGVAPDRTTPAPTVTVTTPEPAATALSATSDEQFLVDELRAYDPWFEGIPDDMLVENAHLSCNAFDLGYTLAQYVDIAAASGISAERAGALAGAAVGVFCPEHADLA